MSSESLTKISAAYIHIENSKLLNSAVEEWLP